MKVGARISSGKLPNVESNVKVERVLSVSGDLDVFAVRSHSLKRSGKLKWNFGLGCANEHENLEVIVLQGSQRFGLYAFKVDQNHIGTQRDSSMSGLTFKLTGGNGAQRNCRPVERRVSSLL